MAFAGPLVAAAGLGLSAYQGQAGLQQQKRALRQQDMAQQRSLADSASARLRAQTDINKADRKKPDIAAILAAAKGGPGLNTTMLTGSGGLGRLGGA